MFRSTLFRGFLLAFLCVALAVTSVAVADPAPGKLFYAKAGALHWRSEINVAAPFSAPFKFDLAGCYTITANPCRYVTIPAGGAQLFDSTFINRWFDGPEIGIIDSPSPGASSFLVFDDGQSRTAFTAPTLKFPLQNATDDVRATVASSTKDKTTCATLYNDSDSTTAVLVRSFGADGQPANDVDGNVAPADLALIPAHSVSQVCLGDHLKPDGSLYTHGPNFPAGSVHLTFGCGGFINCPGPEPTWFLVTKGPSSGATVETLAVENVAAGATASSRVSAETTAGSFDETIVIVHGTASRVFLDAIKRHNDNVLKHRPSAR